MKEKVFKKIQMGISALLASSISLSIVMGYWAIPAIVVPLALVVLMYLKGKVDDVLTDERVYEVAGKAARMAYTIFGIGSATIGAILIALKDPMLSVIGYSMAYGAGALMLIYMAFFWYYDRK